MLHQASIRLYHTLYSAALCSLFMTSTTVETVPTDLHAPCRAKFKEKEINSYGMEPLWLFPFGTRPSALHLASSLQNWVTTTMPRPRMDCQSLRDIREVRQPTDMFVEVQECRLWATRLMAWKEAASMPASRMHMRAAD
ncbi:hypothetical protein M433DRAFT_416255 [Acidomyces richmondensis BFW]|nr:MAG: hypothetical protein FE78DRAFT_223550 [Acidomyces sp. 'richmondensis']KYG48446.1 hypothetical protein M433DRAFT_416255 [Acidomyces richmondensis BFW]